MCSCSKNNVSTVVYKGESDNWSTVYTMYFTNNTHSRSDFKICYKGTDRNSIEYLEYSIDGTTEGQSGRLTLDNDGEATGTIQLIGGLPDNNTAIDVTVRWNKSVELFALAKAT